MTKKLLLVIGDEKRELLIEGYQLSDNIYEEYDLVIEIFPQIVEVVAEDIKKPLSNGIYNEGGFSDVKLHETGFGSFLDSRRLNYAKYIIEKTDGLKLIENYKLVTQPYVLNDVQDAVEELVEVESSLTKKYLLKISESPEIKFLKGHNNLFIISEIVELYQKVGEKD
jgi:hypothetical protein